MERLDYPSQLFQEVKHEIPFTNFDFTDYYETLYLPEQFRHADKSVIDQISGSKQYREKIAKDYFDRVLIPILKSRKGSIVDVGSGESGVGAQVQEALNEQRVLSIDRSVSSLQKVKREKGASYDAVASEATHLPVPDSNVQLLLSHHMIPYFLENRGSENFERYLLRRNINWELTKFSQLSKTNQENSKNKKRRFDLIRIRDSVPKVECMLQYDLSLLAELFAEIHRVLTPEGEARLGPFGLYFLFDDTRFNAGYTGDLEEDLKRSKELSHTLSSLFAFDTPGSGEGVIVLKRNGYF